MPKRCAMITMLLLAVGSSAAQTQQRVTRFDQVVRGAETSAPAISDRGRARLASPTPDTALWLGLSSGR